jgi:cell surface protein SprA
MTYNTWNTTFEKFNADYSSNNFNHFKDYRITIAQRLASQRAQSSIANSQGYNGQTTADGFPDGYGPTSQEVLIPAFLAAYSGKSPDHIGLTSFPGVASMSPNWSINYGGLTNIKIIKKYFRTVTLAHAYRSSYSVNSFSTSLDFNQDQYGQDGFSWTRYTLGNFIPQREINAVSISEQFSPLISIDATMINSVIAKFEIKRSRNLSFGLNNNQITEMQSKEFIFGTGYRYKDLTFQINSKTFKSDLNLRADVSIRNDYTIIHKLEITQAGNSGGYDQLTAGQKMITIKISADYQLGQNFNLRLFYDRIVRKPKISTSFDTYNTNVGISVRFTLSQ